MRLKVVYKTSKIPSSYRMMMVSLIKMAIKDYNQELFEELYFFNEAKNKKSKDFTFSVFLKDYKKTKDEFIVDEITLNISSPNKRLMLNLYNALLKLNSYNYKNVYELNKSSINIVHKKNINLDYAIFKTMSPVAIKNKDGRFLDIDSNEYKESLNYIVDTSLKNYRGFGLTEPINFIPINMKKIVVKESIKSFNLKTNKDYIFINSYSGMFRLEGSPIDLNDIYMLGIGFRRNQGFGMIDLV